MKKYEFNSNGEIPEDCKHIVEYGYGCDLQFTLMWQLINVCGIVLDKENFSQYCNELGDFIEKQYQLNQNGEWILSHYSSLHMDAELFQMFMCSKFGNEIYAD